MAQVSCSLCGEPIQVGGPDGEAHIIEADGTTIHHDVCPTAE